MDNNRYLIEECSALTIGAIKHDLWRCRRMEADIKGAFSVSHGSTNLLCDYWFEYTNNEAFLVLSTGMGHLPQRILLAEKELYFGSRSYLVCECGKQCNSLYLPSGQTEWRCRSCYRLQYELTTINRSSIHGWMLYKTNRTIKLMNQQPKIKRVIYKNKFTKRYNRFLNLCRKAGLNDVVINAQKLMTAINA